MNGYSAAVLGNLNKTINGSDFHKNNGLIQANNTLSESRLAMRAVKALPEEIEIEITQDEARSGTKRSFEISDNHGCTACSNLKPINRLQCQNCQGLGYLQVKRNVEINLSAGLFPGQRITHDGLGRYDFRSGKNCDLVIKININNDSGLATASQDVSCTASVSLYDMVLGAEIEVSTATGKTMMKLDPLTKSGAIYRLSEHGIAGGDQLVEVQVVMPKVLTREQIDLFREMKDLADKNCPDLGAIGFAY